MARTCSHTTSLTFKQSEPDADLLYSVPKTQKYWIQLSLDASICCLAMLHFVYVCVEDKMWCCVVGFLVQILVLKAQEHCKMSSPKTVITSWSLLKPVVDSYQQSWSWPQIYYSLTPQIWILHPSWLYEENPKPKPGNVSCDLSCFKPCSFSTDFVAVAKFMETHNLNQVMLK
jgi:hypothetical protein